MSFITVEAKGVAGQTFFGHLYLVYTDDSGAEYVIRSDAVFNPFLPYPEMEVDYQNLLSNSEDARGEDETPTDRGSVELDLDGRDAEEIWNIFENLAKQVDDLPIDYDVDYQNSNTLISDLLKIVNISIADYMPTNADTFTFGFPAINGEIDYPDPYNPIIRIPIDYKITGTSGGDVLVGNSGSNTFEGGDGPDTYIGGGGTDIYYAGDGDTVVRPNGDDTIYFDNTIGVKS